MPQEFQILRCYSCEKFQVHQIKKATKWQCKVCGEKQSFKKAYFIGSARDCRFQVQQFNFQDGERKLNSIIEQSNECFEKLEEKCFFESAAENMNPIDEYENYSEFSVPISIDDQNNQELCMPEKKQRYEFDPSLEISNGKKSVSNNILLKHNYKSPDTEPRRRKTSTSLHEQSISFDVAFDEYSFNSKASDTFENSNRTSDLKIECENPLSDSSQLPRKRSAPSKNRGFQLIMNAAKALT